MKAAQESWTRRVTGTLLALGLVALTSADRVQAQQRDEYGDVNASDVSYQTVARISYLSGNVSFARGDDPDNWQAADQNVPMSARRSHLHGREEPRRASSPRRRRRSALGARTDLSALNLTDDTKQFAVKSGIASFHVRELDDNDVFEVDTPNAAITFEQAGDYRVEVDDSTATPASSSSAAAPGRRRRRPDQRVIAGEEIRIDGIDSPAVRRRSTSPPRRRMGSVGRWPRSARIGPLDARISTSAPTSSAPPTSTRPAAGRTFPITGTSGRRRPSPPTGRLIGSATGSGRTPGAGPGSRPSRGAGRRTTTAAGSISSSRWYWVPVAPTARYVTYCSRAASRSWAAARASPPRSRSAEAASSAGFLSAPRDPFNPWWGRRAANVNVTNVTYVNRTYVTVVNQNTFVSGGVVTHQHRSRSNCRESGRPPPRSFAARFRSCRRVGVAARRRCAPNRPRLRPPAGGDRWRAPSSRASRLRRRLRRSRPRWPSSGRITERRSIRPPPRHSSVKDRGRTQAVTTIQSAASRPAA